ncbi:MAG: hypothetical protein H7836_07050 [Magnetococcus sp. YQC-3]
MNDLFVLTADADAQAVMREVLGRPHALGIRNIAFAVDRHVGRDSGMIKDGPELTKFQKGGFGHLLLLLDYHGSGREKESVDALQHALSARLDAVTWKERHLAVVAVPELEEWLWHSPDALLKHVQVSEQEMERWLAEFAKRSGRDVEWLRREQPKELFEHLIFKKERRRPRPFDFEKIARVASLTDWQQSRSFRMIAEGLRQWFPIKFGDEE